MDYEEETQKYLAKIVKFKYFALWFGLAVALFFIIMIIKTTINLG